MLNEITELLPALALLLIAVGYASALTVSNAEDAKLGFLHSLLRTIGEMPDPFYRR